MAAVPAYRAATAAAAVFDQSSRGKIAVSGSDRRAYLHAMLTNDIAALGAGTGCYAAFLTPQGRMIADMRVLELGDLVLLDLDETVAQTVLQKLDQFVFSEDVRLGDLGAAFGKILVAGPAAARTVATTLEGDGGPSESDLAAWTEFRNVRASFRGETVLVAATSDLGVPGFDLYVERARVGDLWPALLAAGAEPGDASTADLLRLESGRPAFGTDMDSETIPLEAGIEGRAISFTKGCYPGQEVVIRVLHRGGGRIARRIAGIRIEGSEVPGRGAVVRSGDREVGRVTSAGLSPRANGVIALAMLHRDVLEPGSALVVFDDGRELRATVVPLPFVA
jgi:tRNA-modifying protein YgfZ